MPGPRFSLRETLQEDPRFVRHEAIDNVLQCSVMLEQPGSAVRELLRRKQGGGVLGQAQLLARVTHERIVRLRELTEIDGEPTLVLDLPQGVPLAERLAADERWPHERVAALGRDIAAAARAVHEAGVVHRGIAPENIFVDDAGRAFLAGFTFAKVDVGGFQQTSINHRALLKDQRAAAGLPTYAAPEQLQGRSADHRADVYALGCVLYRALTGTEAQPAPGTDAPRPVRDLVPDCPAAFDVLIRDCLAANPRARCSSMDVVLQRLVAMQSSGTTAANSGRRAGVLGAGLSLLAITTWLVQGVSADDTLRGRPVTPAPQDFVERGYEPRYAASHALVIGCDYKDNPSGLQTLDNAEMDATAVGVALEKIGFDVTPLIGPNAVRDRIEEAIRSLGNTAPDDRVVIYFAGHGDLDIDNSLSLLPTDAGDRTTRHRWLGFDELRRLLGNTNGAKHVLVLLDCCHAGAAHRGIEPDRDSVVPQNYQDAVALRSRARWVVTAAMDTELATDGHRDHSPFATGLLDALDRACAQTVGLFEVFSSIDAAVKASGARQRAWIRDVEGTATRAAILFPPPREHAAPSQPAGSK